MMQVYHATMVRRWHTNAALSHTVDPVGYHSGRMAILALKLWPDNVHLRDACLTHDLGEYASGDIPWGSDAKPAADDVADRWSRENGLTHHWYCDDDVYSKLKFLDKLDAYLWARHHAPHVLQEKAWQDQRDWLECEGKQLGVDVCAAFNM